MRAGNEPLLGWFSATGVPVVAPTHNVWLIISTILLLLAAPDTLAKQVLF